MNKHPKILEVKLIFGVAGVTSKIYFKPKAKPTFKIMFAQITYTEISMSAL
jgi:hypothetical protein